MEFLRFYNLSQDRQNVTRGIMIYWLDDQAITHANFNLSSAHFFGNLLKTQWNKNALWMIKTEYFLLLRHKIKALYNLMSAVYGTCFTDVSK